VLNFRLGCTKRGGGGGYSRSNFVCEAGKGEGRAGGKNEKRGRKKSSLSTEKGRERKENGQRMGKKGGKGEEGEKANHFNSVPGKKGKKKASLIANSCFQKSGKKGIANRRGKRGEKAIYQEKLRAKGKEKKHIRP